MKGLLPTGMPSLIDALRLPPPRHPLPLLLLRIRAWVCVGACAQERKRTAPTSEDLRLLNLEMKYRQKAESTPYGGGGGGGAASGDSKEDEEIDEVRCSIF